MNRVEQSQLEQWALLLGWWIVRDPDRRRPRYRVRSQPGDWDEPGWLAEVAGNPQLAVWLDGARTMHLAVARGELDPRRQLLAERLRDRGRYA